MDIEVPAPVSSRVVEAFDACRKKHADGPQWIFDTDPASASPHHVCAMIDVQSLTHIAKGVFLEGSVFPGSSQVSGTTRSGSFDAGRKRVAICSTFSG
jgi:hypothetical protein